MSTDRIRYQHFFRCKVCGTRFHVTRLTADPGRVKTPSCPRKRCGGRTKPSFAPDVGLDVGAGRAPAQTGANPEVRAYDAALKITAEDHGMTDLRDRARPGENSVPPLRPDLQRQADSFWSGPQKPAARRGKVDMSPIYGARAQSGLPSATRFSADKGTAIAPILQAQPTGSSPIPKHTTIAG